MTDLGRYIDIDGRPAVRFERAYACSVERLWAALTDPDELACWFPSRVELEPRVGGSVRFSGDPYSDSTTGTVLVYDPPRQLRFTWGTDELRLEVEPTDSGARLVLTDLLTARDEAARNASGWMVCLAELVKVLDGTPSAGPHSPDTLPFGPIYTAHVEAGLPSGAFVPAGALGESTSAEPAPGR